MVSLLLVVFLVISIFSCRRFSRTLNADDYNTFDMGFWLVMLSVSLGITLILFFWDISIIHTVGTGNTITRKIEMYEAENSAIEERISVLVNEYMDFESSTFKELKGRNSINLISLFPELKADSVIQQQISVYRENNNKIKELKEQEIDLSKARWKLYFGR